ncbi:hypothetical protein BVRB_6g136740 [Beta vulgaris subsp. vulgaris]|nr:hypothetical protein BVRB_6g136740 [Beta vulgaris subsp. vulgaris]
MSSYNPLPHKVINTQNEPNSSSSITTPFPPSSSSSISPTILPSLTSSFTFSLPNLSNPPERSSPEFIRILIDLHKPLNPILFILNL